MSHPRARSDLTALGRQSRLQHNVRTENVVAPLQQWGFDARMRERSVVDEFAKSALVFDRLSQPAPPLAAPATKEFLS